ncbi:unnamed protein product, partial [Effrenium voratum]
DFKKSQDEERLKAAQEAEKRGKKQQEVEEQKAKDKEQELKGLRDEMEKLRLQLADRDKQLRAVTEQVAAINGSWAQHVEQLHEQYARKATDPAVG